MQRAYSRCAHHCDSRFMWLCQHNEAASMHMWCIRCTMAWVCLATMGGCVHGRAVSSKTVCRPGTPIMQVQHPIPPPEDVSGCWQRPPQLQWAATFLAKGLS